MWFLYVLIGLFSGFIFGIIMVAWCQVVADKKAIETGIIKIDGRFFTLTEITV